MSTVKITELPLISSINANTTNTLFLGVDVPTLTTGKMTVTTLANGLYSNNILNVGANPVLYTNVIGQFSGSDPAYLQVNLQNFNANGSSDYVASTNDSNNSNSYIDFGISGNNYNDAVTYGAFKAYDGYLYVHGPSHTSSQGNLIIGTASANANVMLMVGGTQPNNIMGWITKNSITLNTQSYITFADGTRQTTAGATNAYSIAAFTVANSAAANTVITQGVDATQNTNIGSAWTQANSANVLSQSAFDKANNALANTSGTFNGNLNVLGNVTAYGIATSNLISFVSSITPSTNALVELIGSNTGLQQAPSNDGYMLHITGKDDIPTRVVFDAFGANSYPLLAGRRGRGVAGTPAAVSNNDILFRMSGNGWGSTNFAPLGSARIDFIAAESWTDSARGSKIKMYNSPNGSNTITEIASFNADSVDFTGYINPQKGFIYSPTVYPAAQTAITINMANNSMVRAQTATGLTVTLSNLLAGKEVVVWITNTAGTTQTFTHGVSSLNSTVNATTYGIPSTSTIMVRYFCVDATTQNTFVAITHA
jgi:hypothetical protein